ncbi:STAS/SEC14 domain-containing protein [Stigmatella sp. ncwal1]|uniref:STAS/SEC14 domain-containing protein n=1 Tax=Stigmatella ashevillensis TaxID=2995309 RepID=A0ABT5DJB1_9BACT|nr:STAS/SEC14 domain-containing protein [Stigmatella ashevillena]MDC0713742.1 STAS/SEC14 domain-containing protein [Stigmatella ashevillena]
MKFVLKGPLEHAEMLAIRARLEALRNLQGPLYLLGDVRQSTGYSLEARQAIGAETGRVLYAAVAFFGASFNMRTVSSMILRANSILGRSTGTQAVFKDTEEEARAWLAEQRANPEPAA